MDAGLLNSCWFDWHVARDVANWESFAIWRSWSKKEWLIRSNSCRRTAEWFGEEISQRNMLRVIWQAPGFGLLVVKVWWNRQACLFFLPVAKMKINYQTRFVDSVSPLFA